MPETVEEALPERKTAPLGGRQVRCAVWSCQCFRRRTSPTPTRATVRRCVCVRQRNPNPVCRRRAVRAMPVLER
jgi:hypothetical protein